MTDDELKNIEHSVERHEEAVNQDAAEIEQIKREFALLIEALENLDVYLFQGLNHTTRGEAGRDRYREIVKELKESHKQKE